MEGGAKTAKEKLCMNDVLVGGMVNGRLYFTRRVLHTMNQRRTRKNAKKKRKEISSVMNISQE